ncbi:Zn-dependent protease with chaperone function [Natrinema hispanicum]|uniref:Zn-dependent protease with chaperone function n=1 Tax=Natrinema hispanicum TaxID=392421 RepID=A0A482YEY0_9EURY|nr:peptidase [Natrinema hispanicum]RZV11439.1 Zn-dependent protease with chaperone function [Natrinema hispanicum]
MIATLTLWLGLLVASYSAGRVYGWYTIRRGGNDDRRSRGTYRLLGVVGITTLLLLAFSGFIGATEAALSSLHPAVVGGLATPLAWVPTAAGTIVAVLIAYLGVFPSVRKRRDLEISAAVAVARLGKYLVALTLICLISIAPLAALLGASEPSPWLIPVLFVGFVVGTYGWSLSRVRLSQTVSEPTAEQRRRLEAAADRVGLTATIAGVIPGKGMELARLYLDGAPGNRRLYATDYAFDVCDTAELTALCARVDAADEFRLLERRSLVEAFLTALVVTLTVWMSLLVALAGLLITWPLLTWYLQRCEFAADRRAARAVGADTLASVYEASSDVTDERSRFHERLATRPSTARRVERLRQLQS